MSTGRKPGILFFYLSSLFLFLFFPSEKVQAQHPETYLQPADMKRDLVWLQRKILLYHPACRDSIRYDSVNAAFEIAFYEVEKPMQELPFLRLLRQTLMSLRCGHSTALPSKSFYRYYEKARPKPLFPLQVSSSDNQLHVRFNGSDDPGIKIGDRITAINLEPAEELSNSLLSLLPGDGYHHSFRHYHLSLNFPSYYLFLRGPYYYFQTSLADSSGRTKDKTLSLRTQGKPVSNARSGRSTRLLLKDDQDRGLSVLRSAPSIACIRISRFKGKPGWYKKAFQQLEKGKFQTLILDLRGNSGGSLLEANTLLSYLLADTFSMKFVRRPGPFLFNGHGDLGIRARLSMAIFRWFPFRKNSRNGQSWREGDLLSTRFFYQPSKRHRFKGRLIVLMDGGTFSSATWLAARLRKSGRAELAGEESGGGARGCNAILIPTLTLPETKLRVSLPLYYLDHEMGNIPFRGLLPDLNIKPANPAALLRGLDPDLEFLARQLSPGRK